MLIHWIWLATRPSVNDRTKMALLEAFPDAEDVYFASKEELAKVAGISEDGMISLCDRNLTEAREILDKCQKKEIRVCTLGDPEYPARLRQIADPPLLLYYKGVLPDTEKRPVIAAVGTRHASAYGLTIANRMGYQIAACGGTLISGMAAGIDGQAMRGAMLAGGQVVGVLGCGVDVVYPRSNRDLYDGADCILSEYPPETPPMKWNFPRRNRIISGISNGVVIIEAPERSGALITAREALEQGRDVFAVPGNVDVASFAGSNNLLRDGAIYVRDGWDVMSEYESLYPDVVKRSAATAPNQQFAASKVAENPALPRKSAKSKEKAGKEILSKAKTECYTDARKALPALSENEQAIVDLLTQERLVDDIIAETGLNAATVLGTLTVLQIKGIVKQLPGKRVALK